MQPIAETIANPPAYRRREPSRSGQRRVQPHPARRTLHLYTLKNGNDSPWATLKLFSRALSQSHLPSIFEGEDVTGSLKLDLERDDPIKSIVLSVCSCQHIFLCSAEAIETDHRPNYYLIFRRVCLHEDFERLVVCLDGRSCIATVHQPRKIQRKTPWHL